jgi:hypothetical protein
MRRELERQSTGLLSRLVGVRAPGDAPQASTTNNLEEADMSEYHKIKTLFKRDMSSKNKTLLEGEWTLPEFEYLAKNVWTFTEKVDGTNIRVVFENGAVTYGGRTDEAQIPATLVARLNERFLPRLRGEARPRRCAGQRLNAKIKCRDFAA